MRRIPTSADLIAISPGGKAALYVALHCLFDPPRPGQAPMECLLPVPAWVSYAPVAELAGAKVVELPTGPETDFKITPDQLRAAGVEDESVVRVNQQGGYFDFSRISADDIERVEVVTGVASRRRWSVEAEPRLVAPSRAPGSSVSMLARRHGISPRYVQILFETEGTTFSAYMRGEKLGKAYRMLSDARCAHHSISEIAFLSGFGDLSHFNRGFRMRYGATPSEVRAEALLNV